MKTHKWEYCRSGEAIEFSVDFTVQMMVLPKKPIKCLGFMAVAIEVEGMTDYILPFLCLACKSSQVKKQSYSELQEQAFSSEELWEETYYRLQERALTSALRSRYTIGNISDADASKITETFTGILRMANITHRCPEYEPGAGYTIEHMFQIKIEPRRSSLCCHRRPESDVIVEDGYVEGVVDPIAKPATITSMLELLKEASRRSIEEDGQSCGCQCPICMEDMEMTPSRKRPLRMPCSHCFHAACLLHWLNKSPSCPLCRYQMSAARYRALLYP